MKKIKKLLAVSTFCLASAFAMNCFSLSVSNVWGAIDWYSYRDKTFTEWLALRGAEAATGTLARIALAGSGITGGGSAAVAAGIFL